MDLIISKYLAPCPCGQTPKALSVSEGVSFKNAYVRGACCGEWEIEFRTGYHPAGSNEINALAVAAWNGAQRG